MNNQFVAVILLEPWLGTPAGKIVYLSKFKAAEMSHRGICKVYEEDQKNESSDLEEVTVNENPQGEEVDSKSISKPQENKSLDKPVKDKMIRTAPNKKAEFK